MATITLIGAGRMGSAMLRGWLAVGAPPTIHVVTLDPSPDLLDFDRAGRIRLVRQDKAPPLSDIVVLAIKPQTFMADPTRFAQYAGNTTLLASVMAGVSLSGLQTHFPTDKIVRAMPNTPGAIGKGVTLLAKSDNVTDEEFDDISALFAPLGHVEGPMSEPDLQMGTAISGCGPAYFFYYTDMLAKAGHAAGLDPIQADRLARNTLAGAAALAAAEETSLEALREAVASPGGVTRAALDVMMTEDRLKDMMKDAIQAAIARDTELSGA